MVDTLSINNLKRFSKIWGVFFGTVRVKFIWKLVLSFLTSVYFSKVALTDWGGKI